MHPNSRAAKEMVSSVRTKTIRGKVNGAPRLPLLRPVFLPLIHGLGEGQSLAIGAHAPLLWRCWSTPNSAPVPVPISTCIETPTPIHMFVLSTKLIYWHGRPTFKAPPHGMVRDAA